MLQRTIKLIILSICITSCEGFRNSTKNEPETKIEVSGWDGDSGVLKRFDFSRCEPTYGSYSYSDLEILVDNENFLVSGESSKEIEEYFEIGNNNELAPIKTEGCYNYYNIHFYGEVITETRQTGAIVPNNPPENIEVLDLERFYFGALL